jgi:hypothetical protein
MCPKNVSGGVRWGLGDVLGFLRSALWPATTFLRLADMIVIVVGEKVVVVVKNVVRAGDN